MQGFGAPADTSNVTAARSPGGSMPVLLNWRIVMKKMLSAAMLWTALAVPAFAGCDKPSAPASIPDGKTAAMDDMMAAKKAVDAFKKDMEEYLSCEKSTSKVESAQAELEKVAMRFNTEVRAFKTKG
jgi:hypothetical protein